MANIIKFNPTRKETCEQYKTLLKLLNELNSEKVTNILFYIKLEGDDEAVTCYSPSWEMTGKLREFLNEISLELYVQSFGDTEGVDEDPA